MNLDTALDGTAELAIKVNRASGAVECHVPYSAVYRSGLVGAMTDLGYPPDAEVTVVVSDTSQVSCHSCGLMWTHPNIEPLVCPRCRVELEELE